MFKYRVIRAFVLVWLSVCLTYAGARAALGTILAGFDETSEPSEAAGVVQSVTETELEEDPDTLAEQVEPEDSTTGVVEDADAEAEPDNSEVIEDSYVQREPDDSEELEGVVSDESFDDDVAPVEDEAAAQQTEALDIPSLSEYLSWYTCGSCRRNCSLANPRCHNGSRLAELKAQEYYELYGQ